jgi:hypothetical protein
MSYRQLRCQVKVILMARRRERAMQAMAELDAEKAAANAKHGRTRQDLVRKLPVPSGKRSP